jgi:hypothetical protein
MLVYSPDWNLRILARDLLSYANNISFIKDVLGVNLPARFLVIIESEVALEDIQSVWVARIAVNFRALILVVHPEIRAIVYGSTMIEAVDIALDFLSHVSVCVIDGDCVLARKFLHDYLSLLARI